MFARNNARMGWMTLCATAALVAASPAAAQDVPACQALNLYANATASGLCKSLSTGPQKVCALTDAQPDVHVTFNAATALHITVRAAGVDETGKKSDRACEGNAKLAGTFPGNLRLAAGEPTTVCGVNVTTYVTRLNAVAQMAAAGGDSACLTAFKSAQSRNKINGATYGHYRDLCGSSGATGAACP